MNKRTILNLVLLTGIVVLALLAWFKPGIKKSPVEPPLTTLKAADIRSIEIERHGTDTVKLQRDNAHWQMLAPRQLAADEYLINPLLKSLGDPTISHFAAGKSQLGQYGLADPQLRLHLNNTEIDFGDTEPLEGHRYVKVGDTVYLTDGSLFYRLSHDALWWVDKALLPANAHITALQLPNATLTLKDGKWQLAPANPDISADSIQKLVDAWHDARAQDVVVPEHGKSAGEVAIELAGESAPVRFEILKNPDFLVLVRPDLNLEYRLEQDEGKALLHLETTARKTASGHNGKKETPDARTAGSRNHTPGN